ncbi:MAG: DUF2851 family protein [Bacteroidetes bacterium]|nr:DUF2851 family protein [Bacteroidota bacterium]
MGRNTPNIHERFLRHIWIKKHFTSNLRTIDGKDLQILDIGTYNTGAGPDFLNALIVLNGVRYRGDVEIHRTPQEWFLHNHQRDPRYNRVILHVVLDAPAHSQKILTESGRTVPVLILSHHLQRSIRSLWEEAILDERARKSYSIPCASTNVSIPHDVLEQWVVHLSIERLELKLRKFEERLYELAFEKKQFISDWEAEYMLDEAFHEIPPPARYTLEKADVARKELWEQILYEGIMEALGYSQNRELFLQLARMVPLSFIRENVMKRRLITLDALLFGVSGLLPLASTVHDSDTLQYRNELCDQWVRFSTIYRGEILERCAWNTFPTRPANFPERRIGVACLFIEKFCTEDVFRTIIQCLKNCGDQDKYTYLLNTVLSLPVHPFWNTHYSFTTRSTRSLQSIGATRKHEIIVNVFLPIALLYARTFRDRALRAVCINLYRSLPPRESNSVLRTMERELIRGRVHIDSVCKQQGLIQLYKYYCCENMCAECKIHRYKLPTE